MSADLTGWFTQDSSGSISGPFSTTQVKEKLEDSTIDGLTLVWTNDARYAGDFPDQQDVLFPTDTAVQWKALHAVSSVKAELQSADSDDQSDGEDNVDNVAPAARQAGNAGAEDASIDPSAMVTAPADGMFYYAVASSGEQAGPVSADAFSSLIAAGYVDATTVVWAPGMPSWVPLASVDTLAPLLQPASAGAGASEDGVSGHKRRRAGVADKTDSSQDDAARGAKRPKSKSKQNDKPFTSPWILVQGECACFGVLRITSSVVVYCSVKCRVLDHRLDHHLGVSTPLGHVTVVLLYPHCRPPPGRDGGGAG